MKTYEFSLILTAADVCDALYAAGCDGGTIVTRDGVTHIAFDREAASLEDAIRSAIATVIAAGFHVARVESEQPAARKRSPGSAIGKITIISEDDEHLEDFCEYM